MAKGGGKGAGAKAAKAAHEEEVKGKKAAAAETAESSKWEDGARGKNVKEDKAEKAAKAAAAKAERDRLLAEEDSQIKTLPPVVKPTKKPHKPAAVVPTYSASNLDDALDALDIVNEKNDKASVGTKASKLVETHPERRFKAAFEAYKEAELPQLRKDQPGLRLQQYQDVLYKNFQKHPDNPFNQTTASYDATKADKIAALVSKREATESRLRTE